MAAKDQFLHFYLNETPMGLLRRAPGGKLSFGYDAVYLGDEGAVLLLLSMPLVARQYAHETKKAVVALATMRHCLIGRSPSDTQM
jgi:HipA-like protein